MFTCLCHPTREKDLRLLIRAGARDLATIGRACGAGTGCGTCRPEIRRMLRDEEPHEEAEAAVAAK